MNTTSLLIIHNLICISAFGVVAGFQFFYYFEYETKKIEEYLYFRYFMASFLVIFLVWVLAVIGDFDKKPLLLTTLYLSFVLISINYPLKFFLEKGRTFSIGKRKINGYT